MQDALRCIVSAGVVRQVACRAIRRGTLAGATLLHHHHRYYTSNVNYQCL
jgi:hypothetical protein